MKYYVLLTLDLPNVNPDSRQEFYDYLEKENWTKIANLTTAWKCSFNEGVTKTDAISICKADLENAATHAKVSKYNAAFQAGQSAPTLI